MDGLIISNNFDFINKNYLLGFYWYASPFKKRRRKEEGLNLIKGKVMSYKND